MLTMEVTSIRVYITSIILQVLEHRLSACTQNMNFAAEYDPLPQDYFSNNDLGL